MFNEYIYFPKDKKTLEKDNDIINMIIKEDEDLKLISKNELQVTREDEIYNVEYEKINSEKNCQDGFCKLKIIVKVESPEGASCLSIVDEKIKTCKEFRSDYYLLNSYSDSSAYFSKNIFGKFYEFESKLQQFLSNIIIFTYGRTWVDEILDDESKQKAKESLQKSNMEALVTGVIKTWTLGDIQNILFKPMKRDSDYLYSEIEKALEEKDSVGIKTIKEIKERIELSQWDNLFKDKIEIENPNDKFDNIRNYRNQIAHCKEFSYSDFNKANTLLNLFIEALDKAIEEFDSSLSNPKTLIESLKIFEEEVGNIIKTINFEGLKNTISAFNNFEIKSVMSVHEIASLALGAFNNSEIKSALAVCESVSVALGAFSNSEIENTMSAYESASSALGAFNKFEIKSALAVCESVSVALGAFSNSRIENTMSAFEDKKDKE